MLKHVSSVLSTLGGDDRRELLADREDHARSMSRVTTDKSAFEMNFGHRSSIGHSHAGRALNSAKRPTIGAYEV